MANNNKTVFQRLKNVVIGAGNGSMNSQGKVINYNLVPKSNERSNEVLYTFDNKQQRDTKLAQMRQDRLLAYQWRKIGFDSTMTNLAGLSQVKVMYRDADLMAQFPDIGAALRILSEESTTLDSKGKMLHVYSSSKRIQSILEDLFENRLDIRVMLPGIVHDTAKYGNDFMFLNIDSTNGITGWRKLNVHEMIRQENGFSGMYGGAAGLNMTTTMNPDEVKFVWEGHNETMPYQSWQVAHFRLIQDSIYLPYGVSWMNSARRHWRMLTMMEDGMLLYRLERSVERRIYKVNVGMLDDADVQPYLNQFMDTVKRAPIIDPTTGQLDLRKNFLDVSADYVIPVRPGQDPTSIDVLQSINNPTAMDDIQYIQNKILAVLGIPKSFLNYQESQGKSQNLSLLDIRFNRTVNSVQQAILMELNKIAIIHLYLLGFEDELTNFTLTLNNPSNQIEAMALDMLTKRIAAATSALAEQGGGIPLMSWHQVQKEIMGKTDDEIITILNEIRLEMAIATELQLTSQIIKKTGVFNKADRIYGEPGAQYDFNALNGDDGMGGGMGGGGGAPMPDFGEGLDGLGEPGTEGMGDLGGEEEGQDLESMGNNGQPQLSESKKSVFEQYFDMIKNGANANNQRPKVISKNIIINEGLTESINKLEDFIDHENKDNNLENLLSEVSQNNNSNIIDENDIKLELV